MRDPSASTRHDRERFWREVLRPSTQVDPRELRALVLGLAQLRVLDAEFQERRRWLKDKSSEVGSTYFRPDWAQRETLLEQTETYSELRCVWVPPAARWAHLLASVGRTNLGRIIDSAVCSIERENPTLRGCFPDDYARPELGLRSLRQLLNLVNAFGSEHPDPIASLEVLVREHDRGVAPHRVRPVAKLLRLLDRQLGELGQMMKQTG